jgi:hypothetical protein
MAIPSRQIGWGTEENLLWQISKQLEYLTGVTYNASIRPYKVYTAILSQTGTDAPEQNVLENTLGTGLIYTYDSLGIYYAQLESGTFDPAKTFINITITSGYYSSAYTVYSSIFNIDNSYLIIGTFDESGGTVELDGEASIEIRVYN